MRVPGTWQPQLQRGKWGMCHHTKLLLVLGEL